MKSKWTKRFITEYNREFMRQKRADLRENRKCLNCGCGLKGKLKYCDVCLKKERKRNKVSRQKHFERERVRGRAKHFRYKLNAMKFISKLDVPCCMKCGISDIRVLTINHKKGRSKEEKNRKVVDYIGVVLGRRKINDLEIRCFNCNILYEYEKGRFKLP